MGASRTPRGQPAVSVFRVVSYSLKLNLVMLDSHEHYQIDTYRNVNGNKCSSANATFAVFQGPANLWFSFVLNELPEISLH